MTHSRPWTRFYSKRTQPEISPTSFRNLPEMLRDSARQFGDRTAFTNVLPNGMSGSMSFAQTDSESDAFAAYLREVVQIQPGDRVALQMPNGLAYPVAALGVLKAGGVVVNTNPLYTPREMAHQFADSGAVTLVMIDLFADKLKEVLPQTKIKNVILAEVTFGFAPIPRMIVRGVQKWIKKQVPVCEVQTTSLIHAMKQGRRLLEADKNIAAYLDQTDLDSIALLQYTGGTTGVSKGAMLTHRNLICNLEQMIEMICPSIEIGKETIITALPLYHIFAFTVNLLAFHRLGGHNVMVPSPRPLINLKPVLQKYPVTFMSGVNTLFNGLCNEKWFADHPPAHLKAAVAGGMALQKAVAERWEKIARCPVIEGYGLTESSPVLTFNPLDGMVKRESIGIPVPSTDIECRDEAGKPVAQGEPGELCARGPQIMKGYWQKAEETANVLREGWLLTGDIAVQDSDGYFKIVDRKKDMILVSGFNVYPNELEDVIAQMPEVLEVAVIGIADETTGESVKAFIVKKTPTLTESQVLDFCRKKLTGYKIPKHIEFRKELPKSPIGKILRKELRKP